MKLMSEAEVISLAFGGGKTTATVLRVFAAMALVGGLLAGAIGSIHANDHGTFGLYVALWALLVATLLNAVAWIIDLLRGILAGVWHGVWELEVDEEDEDDLAWPSDLP